VDISRSHWCGIENSDRAKTKLEDNGKFAQVNNFPTEKGKGHWEETSK
jgi:hypothetical protein